MVCRCLSVRPTPIVLTTRPRGAKVFHMREKNDFPHSYYRLLPRRNQSKWHKETIEVIHCGGRPSSNVAALLAAWLEFADGFHCQAKVDAFQSWYNGRRSEAAMRVLRKTALWQAHGEDSPRWVAQTAFDLYKRFYPQAPVDTWQRWVKAKEQRLAEARIVARPGAWLTVTVRD